MFFGRAFKHPATLCALLLALCTLVSYPFVEMGQNDDFAYVRSAKAFAETGHFAYFGWASAMLGWQLSLGGLFIRIFGFSFTAAYASILLVALATAFLLQRTFVHMGLREANAAFATLALVLSPLFIPLSFSFMSDIPGVFVIVLCLYLCLRAIESRVPSQTTAWLIAAAVSNALLGTARQTSWLGVLVIVPSTCWLLRRRRLPLVPLALVWLLCVAFILACLRWFNRQIYATVENPSQLRFDRDHIFNVIVVMICATLDMAFLLSPILIAFVLPFFKQSKRLVYIAVAGAVVVCAYCLLRPDSYWMGVFLAPALSKPGSYVTIHGLVELPDIGIRPVVLQPLVRVIISVISYFSAFACVALLVARTRQRPAVVTKAAPSLLSWRQLVLLLGPFAISYCGFLFLRALTESVFDRYLLPLLIVSAVIAMRFYQERVSLRLPRVCIAALLVFASYGVAASHDMFAMDRARLAAIQQLRTAGLPRTAFYGGFPYDGWTQIDARGYVDVPDIRTVTGIYHLSKARLKFRPCGYFDAGFFPAIRPQYVLSYDDSTCGDPQDKFAPVPYHLWLPPYSGSIFTRGVSPQRLNEPDE
jgi:hypothetical protein